jgi:3-oxoacyl-[acyl-carrier protein] reductase
MNVSLVGKRALVCGSTAGIGKAAAIELAALGAEVMLLARNPEKLRSTLDELPRVGGVKHHWIAADFSRVAGVEAAARELAGSAATPIHILVNNTGGPPGGTAIDADIAAYLAAFESHLLCNQVLTRVLTPGMKTAGYGRIINVISTSVKAPIANLGVSNTIRGAVANWAKTLAGELGGFGITVNNVLPGYTETDRLSSLLTNKAAKSGRNVDAEASELKSGIPAGRFGKPEEIAAAIAFLASPAAGYINGINLPVDGGRLPTL